MTDWRAEHARLSSFCEGLADQLVRFQPNFTMPSRLDGSPVVSAQDLVNHSGISYHEAKARMDQLQNKYADTENKDVHTCAGSHTVPVGVGTVAERATAVSRPRRKKRKREERA